MSTVAIAPNAGCPFAASSAFIKWVLTASSDNPDAYKPVAVFIHTADSYWYFPNLRMPDDYGGAGIYVDVYFLAPTATSGTVEFEAGIKRQAVGDSVDRATATRQSNSGSTDATAGEVSKIRISLSNTQIDGAAAGNPIDLTLMRDVSVGSNMTDSAYVTAVDIIEQ